MKHLTFLALILCFALAANSQTPTPASKGVTYGAGTTADNAITASEASTQVTADQKFKGKIKAKVLSVCQEKGCWMKVEQEGGEPIMVKFKDYGFFMPKNIVGKNVVLDGEAALTETSVKQLKHYAQDAGKNKEEIQKIKEPKKEIVFVASGVLVL